MLVDVLQSRNSFILQTSVRLSMNYTLLTTEGNGAKLDSKFLHIQNSVKKKTLKSPHGDALIDVAKVPAKPLKALSSFS